MEIKKVEISMKNLIGQGIFPPPLITYLKPYSLYVCVDGCLINMIVSLLKYIILTYTASCYYRILAEKVPKTLTKIRKNMGVFK